MNNIVQIMFSVGFPPVSQLHIRHSDETSISVLWSHSSGSASRDGYIVQLFEGNNSTVSQTRTLTRDMRECTFNVLIPGRLYRLIVTTTRQNLRSSVTLEGRTGEIICKIEHISFYTTKTVIYYCNMQYTVKKIGVLSNDIFIYL